MMEKIRNVLIGGFIGLIAGPIIATIIWGHMGSYDVLFLIGAIAPVVGAIIGAIAGLIVTLHQEQ